MKYVYVLYLLLIILIIVAVLLLMSIAGKTIPFFTIPPPPVEMAGGTVDEFDSNNEDLKTNEKKKTSKTSKIKGGELDKTKKIIVVDGLNYICDQFLTINEDRLLNTDGKSMIPEEHLISKSPNIVYIWKALSELRKKYKNEYLIFVIKNQDGYRLSIFEDKLYKKWTKMYKLGIVMCYDPEFNQGPHYVKGRDDKVICELFDRYKLDGYNVELLSKDTYKDKALFGNIPSFKKIKYGLIPFIED